MVKILLIKPPLTLPQNWNGIALLFPPIGLGYLAAVLELNRHNITILDACAENCRQINARHDGIKYLGISWDQITDFVKKENPQIVGITALSVDAVNASLTAQAVKKAGNIKVILGGCHAAVRSEEILSDPNVDVIVIGEGEDTFPELISELIKDDPNLSSIKGIMYKIDNKLFKTEPRPFITDLDRIPFPARHLMNLNKYKKFSYFNIKLLRHIRIEPIHSVITSRACPYGCLFCSIWLQFGNAWRSRSPENVVNEIEEIVGKYGIKSVSIEDDNFTLDSERANRICDLIITKGLNKTIRFDCRNGLRADTLSRNLLIKMKNAGFRSIMISAESGDQDVVTKILKKRLNLRCVEEVAKICKEIGVSCGVFFVIGLPGETKQNLENTVKFARKMKDYGATILCNIAQPYYGTDLYKQSKKNGYLRVPDGPELEMGFLNKASMIETPDFSSRDIKNYLWQIQGSTLKDALFQVKEKGPLTVFIRFLAHPIASTKYIFLCFQHYIYK